MEHIKLRRWVLQSLQLHGYSAGSEVVTYLASALNDVDIPERQTLIRAIIEKLQKLNLKTLVVEREHVELCLQECQRETGDESKIWNVINVFEVPYFTYCTERNKFFLDKSHSSKGLFSDASTKIEMYRRRYNLIFQRTLEHDFFRHQKLTGVEKPNYIFRTVEWFLCSTDRIENAVLVGMLVQKNETTYVVEDLTGSLQLDLTKAKFHDGFYPEHCFILIEGIYEDKVFYVQGIGFPPAETSVKSRRYFGNANTFGGSAEYNLTQCPILEKIQLNNPDAMMVFISDVWLDRIEVLEKLNTLFSGFEAHPPLAFILIGNFLFSHRGSQNASDLAEGFKSLRNIMNKCKKMFEKSFVVLVPGPSDPGSYHILPRPPIPETLVVDLKSSIPNLFLATNPCRIQYCNREIVVFREDLIKKMCRNTIHFPKTGDIPTHFVKTIISQGSLVPLSQNVSPVYWSLSHCLDLYPLPDLIVTADHFNSFRVNYMDCDVVNPGSFVKGGFSFIVYLPASKKIEESVIPDEFSD